MPTARVDIILYIADRKDSRQISLLMNTCCEFFSWPKFLMPLKLFPVATRQTFPCKYTFLTASNASLLLFSSVNHETFLEIYFANINNIFPASNRLLTKITQKMFSETFKHTYNYQEKMAQVFHPRSINRVPSRTHTELILRSF